jgi:hypothetical protein
MAVIVIATRYGNLNNIFKPFFIPFLARLSIADCVASFSH